MSCRRTRTHVALALLLLLYAYTCSCAATATNVAAAPASTLSRHYTLQVAPLRTTDVDDDKQPTLIVVTEVVTLRAADTERLTFPDGFDPIWYYAARRRGLTTLEWSGCGGRWRPAWSVALDGHASPTSGANDTHNEPAGLPDVLDTHADMDGVGAMEAMRRLKHYLAHHVVCSSSTVTACGDGGGAAAAAQFAWTTQFVSALTSSPLSWTVHTPRHIRPVGVHLPRGQNTTDESPAWCSYHHVNHDTICTQHITHWLNAGRAGRDLDESLPAGIYRAALGPLVRVLGTPFHHFEVKLSRKSYRAAAPAAKVPSPPTTASAMGSPGPAMHEIRLRTRMSFVAFDEEHIAELAGHWAGDTELAAYAASGALRVQVIAASRVHPQLRDAVFTLTGQVPRRGGALTRRTQPAAHAEMAVDNAALLRRPEVSYRVHSFGTDHAIFTLYLQPAIRTISEDLDLTPLPPSSSPASESGATLPREGDVLHSLVLFPLHLLRPSLYNLESFLGQTHVEGVHVDPTTNTLAVLLRTNMTALHVHAYNTAYTRSSAPQSSSSSAGEPGVLLARLHLMHGWTSLEEMPRDANSFRVLPQPVVLLQRHLPAEEVARTTRCASRCAREVGEALIDHHRAILWLLRTLSPSLASSSAVAVDDDDERSRSSDGGEADAAAAGCVCPYWLRAVTISGSLIPAPDPAMVFNILALWSAVITLTLGFLMRLQRGLTSANEAVTDTRGDAEASAATKSKID